MTSDRGRAPRLYEVPIHVTTGGFVLVEASSKREALAIARDGEHDDPRVVARLNDAGGFPVVGTGSLREVKRVPPRA